MHTMDRDQPAKLAWRDGKVLGVHNSCPRLPDLPALEAALTNMLNMGGFCSGHVTVVKRQPNAYTSTARSEIVTVKLEDGHRLQLFCKYSGGTDHNTCDHRRGVAYEAQVYRRLLRKLPLSTPRYYGVHVDHTRDETWLFLEYLDHALPVSEAPWSEVGLEAPRPVAMFEAARWLGHFHTISEDSQICHSVEFLRIHDAEYYQNWARRTLQFASPLCHRFPWLAVLCKDLAGSILPILETSRVVVHGEYYPMNILFHSGTVYPVDWESAAFAVGEVDLTSLVDGWPAAIVRDCVTEYINARWPHGAPADFERRYAAAQLYWCLRWLGYQQDWTLDQSMLPYFDRLRSLAEQLGLIQEVI
jgi:aminoglycoside phosphotransferase (APT) family kinase protein